MSAKRITARFESRCTKCTQVVPAGAVCLWTPGTKGVTHVACPEALDVEIELLGSALSARLVELEAFRATLLEVLEDRLLELAGPEPLEPCSACKGAGVVSESINVSDTLDCSDFRSYPHACGTALVNAGDRAVAEVLEPLCCAACGARGVPLDLDVRQTPPEIVCRRCKRKPKCPGCSTQPKEGTP